MLKYLIILNFLHVILTKEIHAKEEDFELTQWKDTETDFDDAIENCDRRPDRKTKWLIANPAPPVSLLRFRNCIYALCQLVNIVFENRLTGLKRSQIVSEKP
jgi:hypothetical protein